MIKFTWRARDELSGLVIPAADDGRTVVDAIGKLIERGFRDAPTPGALPTDPFVDGWSGSLVYYIWETLAAARRRRQNFRLLARFDLQVSRDEYNTYFAPAVLRATPYRGDIEAACDALAIAQLNSKPAGWVEGQPLVSYFSGGIVI